MRPTDAAIKTLLVSAVVAGLGSAGVVGVRMSSVHDRLAGLEEISRGESVAQMGLQSAQAGLAARVGALNADLDKVREWLTAELESAQASGRQGELALEELNNKLQKAREQLHEVGADLEQQGSRFEELVASQPTPRALDARFTAIGNEFQERCEALSLALADARGAALANQVELDRLDGSLKGQRDLGIMWGDIVAPVVQLAGDSSVGSGVLLESRERADGTGWDNFLLTAWHVVRDIQGSLDKQDMPVPVTIYSRDGSVASETAQLLHWDARIDVALLRVNVGHELEHGARLASRERIASMRTFEPIYAVGCPLGNDPIPTPGEISSPDHRVDGQSYWMINAPTYIGNSGGGIFDARSHELMGIFSKIYNYGSLRPTIVPHMGLAMPLHHVYGWLDEVGYASLEPARSEHSAARPATAPR